MSVIENDTIECTSEQLAMLATIAGTLNTRHTFRAHSAILESAQALANSIRKNRNAKRMADKRDARNARFTRTFADYDYDTLATIAELHAVWAAMPKRATIRNIARAILGNSATCRDCVVYQNSDITYSSVDGNVTSEGMPNRALRCDKHAIPANWRDTVRAFRDGSRKSAELGNFAIKRDDMRLDTTVYARHVRKHWHEYVGGDHANVHGHDWQDALQLAFLRAIENGDTITRVENGRMVHVPVYGAMWLHNRQAVNYLMSHRAENGTAIRTMGTGNDTIPEFEFDTFEPRTINDWLAYESHRDILDSHARTLARIERDRETRMASLATIRAQFATLINGGMTVKRIANMLGRTVEGILADLAMSEAPDEYIRPVVITDSEREDARNRVLAQAAHAARLRAIRDITVTIQGTSEWRNVA